MNQSEKASIEELKKDINRVMRSLEILHQKMDTVILRNLPKRNNIGENTGEGVALYVDLFGATDEKELKTLETLEKTYSTQSMIEAITIANNNHQKEPIKYPINYILSVLKRNQRNSEYIDRTKPLTEMEEIIMCDYEEFL